MKKSIILVLCLVLASPVVVAHKAQTTTPQVASASIATDKQTFKARRKLVKQLIKKYKKAPASEKPAIKAQLAQIVGQQVDAQLAYMKERIAAERANLDNWEQKIQQDEANLPAVKAKRVEELLSGEAQKKHKAAKKAWKKQMKAVK